MDCPRCKEPVEEGRCPRCGIVWDPEEADDQGAAEAGAGTETLGEAEQDQTPAGGLISMEVTAGQAPRKEVPGGDWREELRRRLDEHGGKKTTGRLETAKKDEEQVPESSPAADQPQEASPQEAPSGEVPAGKAKEALPQFEDQPPAIFQYQLKQTESRSPLTNPVRPRQPALAHPAKSASAGTAGFAAPKKSPGTPATVSKAPSRSPSAGFPKAARLPFDETGSEPPSEAERRPEASPPAAGPVPPSLPAEILFSRFLAGIIDVTIPAAGAVLLGLLAAWKTGVDVFAGDAWGWLLVLIATFYVLTSFLFLALDRQTPGMRAAELEVVNLDGNPEIAASNLLARVLVFPLALASVGGLLCALFDRRRRCLHDILSRTVVVPVRSLRRGRSGLRR